MGLNACDIVIYNTRKNAGEFESTLSDMGETVDETILESMKNNVQNYHDNLKEEDSDEPAELNFGFSTMTQWKDPHINGIYVANPNGALLAYSKDDLDAEIKGLGPFISSGIKTPGGYKLEEHYLMNGFRIPRFFGNYAPLTMEIKDFKLCAGARGYVSAYDIAVKDVHLLFNEQIVDVVFCDNPKTAEELTYKMLKHEKASDLHGHVVILAPLYDVQKTLSKYDHHANCIMFAPFNDYYVKLKIELSDIINMVHEDADKEINTVTTDNTDEENDRWLKLGYIAPCALFTTDHEWVNRYPNYRMDGALSGTAIYALKYAVPGKSGCVRNKIIKTHHAEFCDSFEDVINHVLNSIYKATGDAMPF